MHLATETGVPVDRYEYGIPGHPGKHIHAHLDVFVNGKPVQVPPGMGIDFTVPGVQKGSSPDGTPSYGGIQLCARACIAALHTHDDGGVMHIESQKPRSYSLGNFLPSGMYASTGSASAATASRMRPSRSTRTATASPAIRPLWF